MYNAQVQVRIANSTSSCHFDNNFQEPEFLKPYQSSNCLKMCSGLVWQQMTYISEWIIEGELIVI